ncbi:hypothetical protein V6260_00785 [Pseudoalteromonas aliena]|uniref:hypothetical protein n=1 Tax=Pseudoalteromonas aliena TaxID=247523 RepID=UPI00311E3912
MSNETNTTLTCGLIMPISSIDGCNADHWEEVRVIVREALSDSGFKVDLVSDSNEVGIIQNRIVNNIYNSDIVVCDVSGKNPNVMFELGMRLAFDKPTVIIKDDVTNYSFDTAPIEHIEYPRDLHYQSIVDFKNLLKKKVKATYQASLKPEYTTFLKHFGEFKISTVSDKEISSENYILKAIGELSSSVKRMEKNTVSFNETNKQSSIMRLNISKVFEEVFESYMALHDVNEFELGSHKESLIPLVTVALTSNLKISEKFAQQIAKNEMQAQIRANEPF